jgi:hypothetical protein
MISPACRFNWRRTNMRFPYYVVTRNMVHDWNSSLGPLDPARYNMPEQIFDLTLQNLRGDGAKVSAWDPMTDQSVPVSVLASDKEQP